MSQPLVSLYALNSCQCVGASICHPAQPSILLKCCTCQCTRSSLQWMSRRASIHTDVLPWQVQTGLHHGCSTAELLANRIVPRRLRELLKAWCCTLCSTLCTTISSAKGCQSALPQYGRCCTTRKLSNCSKPDALSILSVLMKGIACDTTSLLVDMLEIP